MWTTNGAVMTKKLALILTAMSMLLAGCFPMASSPQQQTTTTTLLPRSWCSWRYPLFDATGPALPR